MGRDTPEHAPEHAPELQDPAGSVGASGAPGLWMRSSLGRCQKILEQRRTSVPEHDNSGLAHSARSPDRPSGQAQSLMTIGDVFRDGGSNVDLANFSQCWSVESGSQNAPAVPSSGRGSAIGGRRVPVPAPPTSVAPTSRQFSRRRLRATAQGAVRTVNSAAEVADTAAEQSSPCSSGQGSPALWAPVAPSTPLTGRQFGRTFGGLEGSTSMRSEVSMRSESTTNEMVVPHNLFAVHPMPESKQGLLSTCTSTTLTTSATSATVDGWPQLAGFLELLDASTSTR
eukprot:TRINITY_DN592_c0_g1_i1.p1 TRINITY_DN592_c0_g1~~TRINITY_DN592_c0_g1_i1.p1  ORF type:complete len:312 (+),score=35.97 TRINITY_DN592_c0_g1_i1:86-937(+)